MRATESHSQEAWMSSRIGRKMRKHESRGQALLCLPRKSPLMALFLSLAACLLENSLGFLPKHPTFAVARHRRSPVSIQRLYIPELDALNQTDSILHGNGAKISLSKRKFERLDFKSKSTGKSSTTVPPSKYNLTLLLIDHYDSFTYNLYDMLAQLCENPPIVLAKDAFEDWSQVEEMNGASTIDGIILSPGPGTPTHPEDIGTLSPSIIQQNPDLPILGVCLGHQIMGHVYGANVDLCGPVHGQVRPIEQVQQSADPLWENIPTRFNVTRYHSLGVSLPGPTIPLRSTAYSGDGQRILMGMSHTENPHYGVQFHPESIGSEYGHQLLRNFCDVCRTRKRNDKVNGEFTTITNDEAFQNPPRPHGHDRQTPIEEIARSKNAQPCSTGANHFSTPKKSKYQVYVYKVPTTKNLSPLEVFEEFLSKEQYSVWLDTSIGVQSANITDATTLPSYSSILGAGRNTVEYFGKEHETEEQGLFCYDAKAGSTIQSPHDDILTFLQEEHAQATDAITLVAFEDDTVSFIEVEEDGILLPFDFRGGHVGYLGYEVRHDSERFLEEEEHGSRAKWKPVEDSLLSPPRPADDRNQPKERTPTAAFLFLDKSWVYDHSADEWYLISLVDQSNGQGTKDTTEDSLEWMRSTSKKMNELGANELVQASTVSTTHNGKSTYETVEKRSDRWQNDESAPRFVPNRSRVCYNQNFVDCQEQIRLGESYELCLTNQLEAYVTLPVHKTALDLYKVLRKRNPAPFSAFLNWNTSGKNKSPCSSSSSSLAVCCSSPERFVSVKRTQQASVNGCRGGNVGGPTKLQVEAKPIKGTCARVIPHVPTSGMSLAEVEEDQRRAIELKESVKNRAENLMIVDLLRNDLSRVCDVGSVHVAKLMDIESYATVHQMVSTIRGTLDTAKTNSVDVLKATFPGGSMTGAPKIRTMEILERLEEGVSRGPYSGCLGYISMNGSMDMNIVIRSAVLAPKSESRSKMEGSQEWKVSIGAGGAITALSESTDEYEEMILKASAVMGAVEEWTGATYDKDGAALQSPRLE